MKLKIIGMLLLPLLHGIGACNLHRDFEKKQEKILANSVPAPEAKGDRPQETGEGIPGYLLDPDLLANARVGTETEISGAAGAVRSIRDNATQAQKVWLIGYQDGTHSFRREQESLILSGRLLATVTTQENGAFTARVALAAGEMLFLRLNDGRADAELAFNPGKDARDRVVLDAVSGKFLAFDSASTQELSTTIDPLGSPAAQLAFLKATRACRSCTLPEVNLAGVDLNGCVLISSNLRGADLTGADLRNCQLQMSTLSNANLTRANLSAADLTQADLGNAILNDAVLTNVKGYPAP
jgi:hypothetical protein